MVHWYSWKLHRNILLIFQLIYLNRFSKMLVVSELIFFCITTVKQTKLIYSFTDGSELCILYRCLAYNVQRWQTGLLRSLLYSKSYARFKTISNVHIRQHDILARGRTSNTMFSVAVRHVLHNFLLDFSQYRFILFALIV